MEVRNERHRTEELCGRTTARRGGKGQIRLHREPCGDAASRSGEDMQEECGQGATQLHAQRHILPERRQRGGRDTTVQEHR